jgi:ribonuclease P protein component
MFSRKNRLLSKKDFGIIYRSGRFFSFENISIKILENKLGYSRIGLSVGIKFYKQATERNRIKRKLREIVRKNWEKIKTGFDIVIIVKSSKNKKEESQALEKFFLSILEKGRIIIS